MIDSLHIDTLRANALNTNALNVDTLNVDTLNTEIINIDSLRVEEVVSDIHLFGADSRIVNSFDGVVDSVVSLSNDLGYEITVLVLLLLYLIWIGRSLYMLSDVGFRIRNPFEEPSDAWGLGRTMKVGDILLAWFLSISMGSLFFTLFVDVFSPYSSILDGINDLMLRVGVVDWIFGIIVCLHIMALWSYWLIRVMGFMFKSRSLAHDLETLRVRIFKNALIWIMPFVLMCAMEIVDFYMTYFTTFLVLFFLFIYLFRTFLLFTREKVSILHWILYLCAVEIFPITLIWAIFVR